MPRIHFVGIAGVGMSALAEVALSRGASVSGSDPGRNEATVRLRERGVEIVSQQESGNILRFAPDLVVATAAVRHDHPELQEARRLGIPVVSRADFLGRVMDEQSGPRIAVTGTHGKTTTTAMLASALIEGERDPTVLVGGELDVIGGNVRVGRSGVFVTEACEAYDSFLSLRPDVALITNIEADHLDYYGTLDRVMQSFRKFARQVRPGGALIWCADDPGATGLIESLPPLECRTIAYGIGPREVDGCFLHEADAGEGRRQLTAVRHQDGVTTPLGPLQLAVPGRHNALNAIGAAAAAMEVGVSFEAVSRALAGFRGARRRFERIAEVQNILIVDDYAHHPTEIRATLTAAREDHPTRRIVAVFQPHLYSRTRDFLQEFAESLSLADCVLVTDIYAAREQPIPGVTAMDIVCALSRQSAAALYVPDRNEIVGALRRIAQPGDLVITLGAGDLDQIAREFADSLEDDPWPSAEAA